jgi:hypothetical protein
VHWVSVSSIERSGTILLSYRIQGVLVLVIFHVASTTLLVNSAFLGHSCRVSPVATSCNPSAV